MDPESRYMHAHPHLASSCSSTLRKLSVFRPHFHLFSCFRSVASAYCFFSLHLQPPQSTQMCDDLSTLSFASLSMHLTFFFLICFLVSDWLCKFFFLHFECSNKKLQKANFAFNLLNLDIWLHWLNHNCPLMNGKNWLIIKWNVFCCLNQISMKSYFPTWSGFLAALLLQGKLSVFSGTKWPFYAKNIQLQFVACSRFR